MSSMSTLNSTYEQNAVSVAGESDARALLGQVMGYVAVTVGFTALGAYLGRDLDARHRPGHRRLRRSRPVGDLAGRRCHCGILIYAIAGLVIFGGFTIVDFNRLRSSTPDAAVPIAAGIFIDVLNIFVLALDLFGGRRD